MIIANAQSSDSTMVPLVDVTIPTVPRVVRFPRFNLFGGKSRSIRLKQKPANGMPTHTLQQKQSKAFSFGSVKIAHSVSLARIDHEIATSHTAFVSNVDFATRVALLD
jgi:hypothetical protein